MALLRHAGKASRQALLSSCVLQSSNTLHSLSVIQPLLAARHTGANPCKPGLTSPWTYATKACFASSSEAKADAPMGGDLGVRFIRMVAIGMLLVAATKVVPMAYTSTVPNAVRLCHAREPIMQKAAANRVRVLAELDHTLKELIAADVCPKLLEMLKPEVDAGVAQAVLAAIKEISRISEGRQALVEAGAVEVLGQALQQQWLTDQEQSVVEASKIRSWLQQ